MLWILTECGWSEDIDCKVVLKRHGFRGLIRYLAILLSGGLSSRKVVLVELVLRKVSVVHIAFWEDFLLVWAGSDAIISKLKFVSRLLLIES